MIYHILKIIASVFLFVHATYGYAQIGILSATSNKILVDTLPNGNFRIYEQSNKTLVKNADSIEWYKNSYLIVTKDKKKGLFNEAAETIIPIQFDQVERLYNSYWLVNKKGQKGIYHSSGKIILTPIFDNIMHPYAVWVPNAEFIVQNQRLYGIYNDKGEMVIPTQYDTISFQKGMFVMKQGEKAHYLVDGKHYITDCNIVSQFTHTKNSDDRAYQSFYIFEKDNKYGIMNKEMQVCLKAQYDYIENITAFFQHPAQPFFKVKSNGKMGIINLENKEILPIAYKDIKPSGISRLFIVENDQGKQLFNAQTTQIIENLIFNKLTPNDYYSSIEKDGYETCIDNFTYQLIFPFKYQQLVYINEGKYFLAQKDGKHGLINLKDEIIIPLIYDKRLQMGCGNNIVICKDGKYGIINLKNQLLYGMIPHPILAYSNYFEIFDSSRNNPQLDCHLKEIPTENKQ